MKPQSPVKTIKGYVPFKDQGPLFRALHSGPWHTLRLRYGNTARRKNIVYYDGDAEAAYAYTKAATDKDRPISYSDGPAELRALRKRLQADYGFSFSLCYVNYYRDEDVGIGWHNDAEEIGSQVPVRMVCLGGTRAFSIWKVRCDEDGKLQKPFAEWDELTESGDLVEMPVAFHEEDAYRHAILPQKQFAAPRISLTFRSPDLSANGPWSPSRSLPYEYEPDFLNPNEASALLAVSKDFPRERVKTRWGLQRRHVVAACFSDMPSRRARYGLPSKPKTCPQAPPAVQAMLDRLSKTTGRTVNYAALMVYEGGQDSMGWHQHEEDKEHDTPVWIISLGAERTFGLREVGKKGTVERFKPKHGSLITLPSSLNDTHLHAVLPDKDVTGIRFAWNCKAMDHIYYANSQAHAPRVWCCKSSKRYPLDAVYLGCRTVRGQAREGTPFGNALDPFKVRNKKSNPWIADNTADFRADAVRRMRDPEFRKQVEALRGKDLLCWCEHDGPKRAEFCHARVWLELANAREPSEGMGDRKATENAREPAVETGADVRTEQLLQTWGGTK